jgi:hypothetical protein
MTGPFGDLLAGISRLLAKGGLWLGVAISLVLAIGSIVLVVLIVISWPADHFKPRGERGEASVPGCTCSRSSARTWPASCSSCSGW